VTARTPQVKHVKHDGNVTLDQIIDVARKMRERSMARTLAGTVKVSACSTCVILTL
jgi:ribosomal protein L11